MIFMLLAAKILLWFHSVMHVLHTSLQIKVKVNICSISKLVNDMVVVLLYSL